MRNISQPRNILKALLESIIICLIKLKMFVLVHCFGKSAITNNLETNYMLFAYYSKCLSLRDKIKLWKLCYSFMKIQSTIFNDSKYLCFNKYFKVKTHFSWKLPSVNLSSVVKDPYFCLKSLETKYRNT